MDVDHQLNALRWAAIREARIATDRAIAAGDLDAVASFWTEDVTIRRGLGQSFSGRWLIRSKVFVAPECAGVGCSYAAVP